ncbi:type IV secretion system protein VirB5 [Roseovarius tolerans]|uniref:Type IV secretion system protein VirB5 n=1 Tax=Roseovarius tolerans TaxID=74031 RepID=A0A1H8D6F9_9RHOB|nr:type IV secretion system protein [Roseovarius tolerans]SEN02880.1 type IV secretion system protein VirB5 [Roseovarius tolerans]
MIRIISAIITCAMLAVSPAIAQGVPTIDTRNIAQEIRQLQQMLEDFGIQTDQLDTLLEQLDLVQQQLDTLNETYAALTGATDIIEMAMGGDLDGLLDQEFGDLLGTIRQIQSGDFSGLIGNAAPQMEGRMTQALEDAGFDQDSLSDMASSGNPGAERIASQAGTGAMMSAAAENSYDEAAQSLERVGQLVSLIPDMETLKEAVDHNTRVTAELAIAMTRMWELEAIQTVGAGQSGVVDAATLAEERRYMDFTLPDLRAD